MKFLKYITLAALLSLASCSGTDGPGNIEPEIHVLPASGITRSEAVISARVSTSGTARIDAVSFSWGTDSTRPVHRQDGVPVTDGVASLALEGLSPGRTYYFMAEGGNGTATIRSRTGSFTTDANALPRLGSAKCVSTGPLGAIVLMEITDDGGEPLTAAGCYVTASGSADTTVHSLTTDECTAGHHRLVINGLSQRTAYYIIPFAAHTAGEARGGTLEYTTGESTCLEKAGDFSRLFAMGATGIDTLRVNGPMDGDDFRCLRILAGADVPPGCDPLPTSVTAVDLSDASIVSGGGSYDGQRYTRTDTITTGLLAGCSRLKWLALPHSASVMERGSIDGTPLRAITVSAGIVSLEPSASCTTLEHIDVSEANTRYASNGDGVVYDKALTQVVWFPQSKVGVYVMPATVTTLGTLSFAGTLITHLTLPASITDLERGAFAGSSLQEVTVLDGVGQIHESLFQGCTSLATVKIGSGVNFVGNYAFSGCPLNTLQIGASTPPYASPNAFYNKTLSLTDNCTLYVPKGCKTLYRNHSMWGKFSVIKEF